MNYTARALLSQADGSQSHRPPETQNTVKESIVFGDYVTILAARLVIYDEKRKRYSGKMLIVAAESDCIKYSLHYIVCNIMMDLQTFNPLNAG